MSAITTSSNADRRTPFSQFNVHSASGQFLSDTLLFLGFFGVLRFAGVFGCGGNLTKDVGL